MKISKLLALLAFAFVISGCKKVDVLDVQLYGDNACVVYDKTSDHPNGIECFGNDPGSLPTPSDTNIFNQWVAQLEKPVSLALLAGVCVVDENGEGKGQVRCIDKFSPRADESRLLTTSARAFLSAYDISRIEYAIVNDINLDYLGCGLASSLIGSGKTLVCWTKSNRTPIDLVADGNIDGISGQITSITEFSMAREQLCILGTSNSGPIAACMQPTVVDNKVAFTNINQNLNIAATKVAAGGLSAEGEVSQSYCYSSSFGDIGCADPALASIPSGDYAGIWMGPKSSPYFRSRGTVCATAKNGIECAGYYAPSILTESFLSRASNIKSLVISDAMACYLASSGSRNGVVCQGIHLPVKVPSYFTL